MNNNILENRKDMENMLIDKEKPFYSIIQVAEILDISADRLRTYDEEKLVFPSRKINGRKRLYSKLDIEWLISLRKIIAKNKLNIYSFKIMAILIDKLSPKELLKLKKVYSDEIWDLLLDMKKNPNFKYLVKNQEK